MGPNNNLSNMSWLNLNGDSQSGGSGSTGGSGSSGSSSIDRSNKDGGNGTIWGGIFDNLGEWMVGISSIIQSSTGKYPTYNYYQEQRNNNTGTWLIVGGVLLVVVVLVIVLMRK